MTDQNKHTPQEIRPENEEQAEERKKLIEQCKAELTALYRSPSNEAEQFTIKTQKANLLVELGLLYLRDTQISKARDHLMMAFRLFRELNDEKGMASVNGALGSLYLAHNDHYTAKEYFERAYAYWGKSNYLNEKIVCLRSLGLTHLQLNEEEEGVTKILDSAKIAAHLDDTAEFLFSMQVLLEHYEKQQEYDVLRELKLKVLEYWEKHPEYVSRRFKTLVDLGVLSQVLEDYPAALQFFKHAFNIAFQMGDFEKTYLAQGFIGEVYVQLEKLEQAKSAYLKAFQTSILIGLEEDHHSEKVENARLVLKTLGIPEETIKEKEEIAKSERTRIKEELDALRARQSQNASKND